MYKFLPFMTKDFSVGLYDEDVNDIYHSAFGALNEAYEKFVNPFFEIYNTGVIKIQSFNILDICYGIGYNTKAFLSECIKSDLGARIDCVDIDENLIKLSPFIKNKVNLADRLMKKNY